MFEYLLSLFSDKQRFLFCSRDTFELPSVDPCEHLKLDSSTSAHTQTFLHHCDHVERLIINNDLALKWHTQAVFEYNTSTPPTHSKTLCTFHDHVKTKRATSPCLLVL
jgi:hypothetical protein